mgnify:CR=1 FL=1
MALDGITVAALTAELNQTILNGRISKIAQPEADELLLTIKAPSGQYRLSLSASASLPYLYLTAQNKSHDCTEFLHGITKTYCQRPDYFHQSARIRTNHPDYGRAFG